MLSCLVWFCSEAQLNYVSKVICNSMASIFTQRGEVDKTYGFGRTTCEGRDRVEDFANQEMSKTGKKVTEIRGRTVEWILSLISQNPFCTSLCLCSLRKSREVTPAFKSHKTWLFVFTVQPNYCPIPSHFCKQAGSVMILCYKNFQCIIITGQTLTSK